MIIVAVPLWDGPVDVTECYLLFNFHSKTKKMQVGPTYTKTIR